MKRAFTFLGVLLGVPLAIHACGGGGGNGAGGGKDAGADVGPGADGGTEDGAGDADGGCPTPASVAGFTPPAYAHARQQLGACMPADFAQFDSACVNVLTGSAATCGQFRTAHAGCYACLVSNLTDTRWGPLVVANAVPDVNVAGCLELTDPGALSCSTALAGVLECEHAACDLVCPATDVLSLHQYELCAQAATGPGGGCPPASCLSQVDAAAASPCLLPADAGTDDLFLSVAPVFCGGLSDGGLSDAGGD